MPTTIDTLLVRIEADMGDVRRKLDKLDRDVKRGTTGVAASFKKLGTVVKGAAVAVIVQQLARAGMAAINLASDVEEMQSKSSIVFGKFRDDVVADLEEFGNAVGRSTFELEGMASSIQDTFVPMGFARGEAAKLSVDLTKLAVDVASFNNASDTETMEAFQSALVGNHETVRRFGVVITEATLKQELLRMGIKRTGNEVTNAEKVQARLNLILAGTTDAHGDAIRTSESFANKTKKLKAEFMELAKKIGDELLPMAKALVTEFTEALDVVESFLQFIGALPTHSSLQVKLEAERATLERLKQEYEDQSWWAQTFGNTSTLIELKTNLIETLEKEILAQEALRKLNEVPLPPLPLTRGEILERLQANLSAGIPSPETLDVIDPSDEQNKIAGSNAVLRKRIELINRANELRIYGNKLGAAQKLQELERFNQYVKFTDVEKELGELETARMAAMGISSEQMTSQLIEQNTNLTDSLQVAIAIQEGFGIATETSREKLIELQDTITQINEGPSQELINNISDLEDHLSGMGPKIEGAEEALEKLRHQLAASQPFMQTFNDAISGLSSNLSSSFADMVVDGKLSLDSLKDIFSGFVKTILQKAIELFVVNAIMNAIFGGVEGYDMLPVGKIGGKAGGGTVQPRTPVLVGERGPELFVPSGAGAIMNNMNTNNALSGAGGTVVNQTINISTGVAQTVRTEVQSMLPQIAEASKMAVLDARRRGGSFASAF
jgi:hypothetical protein